MARRATPLRRHLATLLVTVLLCADAASAEIAPQDETWANHAPTRVTRVVDRGTRQLLYVQQGRFETWVLVPHIDARVGDYVLLAQGRPLREVEIPELGERADVVVEIERARAVDLETARRILGVDVPEGALGVGRVYAELGARADTEIVVQGVVTKVAGAIGWYWVHLRDASGDPAFADLDLTVQTHDSVTEGQRVEYRGMLRKDVDLGFGYEYDAMLRDASLVR